MADRREPKATGEPPFAARTPPAPPAYSPAPSAAASCCTPLATARSPLALLSVSRKSPSICSFSRTGARRPSVPQSQPGLHFSLSRRSWLCRSLSLAGLSTFTTDAQVILKIMKKKAPNSSSASSPARRKSPPNSSPIPGLRPIPWLHWSRQGAVPNRESRNKLLLWAHFSRESQPRG
jgi:hypothetical protein